MLGSSPGTHGAKPSSETWDTFHLRSGREIKHSPDCSGPEICGSVVGDSFQSVFMDSPRLFDLHQLKKMCHKEVNQMHFSYW